METVLQVVVVELQVQLLRVEVLRLKEILEEEMEDNSHLLIPQVEEEDQVEQGQMLHQIR